MTTTPKNACSPTLDDTIPEVNFEAVFPDDPTAEAWCSRRRWRIKPNCPFCGSFNINTSAGHELAYKCGDKECGRRFSVKTGTIFEDLSPGCRELVLAISLMLEQPSGISPQQLSDRMSIPCKLAWHLIQRILRRYQARPVLTYEWIEVDPENGSAFAGSGAKKGIHRRLGRAVVVDGMANDSVAADFWDGLKKMELAK